MEHGVGMDLATASQVNVLQQHHPWMQHAAFRHHTSGADHPVGPHMGIGSQDGVRADYGAGMHARSGPLTREEGFEGLREGEARLGHRDPGQAPCAGQLLQAGIWKEQYRRRGCGFEAGRRGVTRLKEAELTLPSPLKGFRPRNLRIGGQIPGAGLAHRGELAEQMAEAHGKGEPGQWRSGGS